MRYRAIPDTGLSLSEIGFGCGGNAGLMVRGDRAEQIRVIARALDQGINYFDLAPDYGDGLAESNLGIALKEIGYPVANAPEIDFVSPTGDLSTVGDNVFDVVLSCHSIEHQPDLIAHLQHIARILRAGGRYLLLIPDKRYCFDHFLAASTVADVVQTHRDRLRTHSVASVIEHRALTTHNDSARHWNGDHEQPGVNAEPQRITQAIHECEKADGDYIDVHAWQFTPQTFRSLMNQLVAIGLTTLRPVCLPGTPHAQNEFCAMFGLGQ